MGEEKPTIETEQVPDNLDIMQFMTFDSRLAMINSQILGCISDFQDQHDIHGMIFSLNKFDSIRFETDSNAGIRNKYEANQLKHIAILCKNHTLKRIKDQPNDHIEVELRSTFNNLNESYQDDRRRITESDIELIISNTKTIGDLAVNIINERAYRKLRSESEF